MLTFGAISTSADPINDLDDTVVDKDIWTDDLCGGAGICLDEGSGGAGDERRRLASCRSDVHQQFNCDALNDVRDGWLPERSSTLTLKGIGTGLVVAGRPRHVKFVEYRPIS